MKKAKGIIIAFLALFIVLFVFNQMGEAKEWDFQPIYDVNKAWEINFNIPLDSNSLTAESVYILDEKGKHPVTLKLIGGESTVQVIPTMPYEVGKQYKVMVTEAVKSSNGKLLTTSVELPFRVVKSTEKIIAVQSLTSGILKTLTVTASPDVYKIKVGAEEMDYKGYNRYKTTLVDARIGSTVSIVAYNEDNKVIERKNYKIEQ